MKVSGAIDREMLNLFNAGLAEPTLSCFNRWKKEYKSWNDANTTNVLPDSIMAARYAAVVRKLGGKVEMDLDTEIKIAAAQGDVAKTIQCIETVLTDREADDVANGKGVANAAKFDPRKSEKPTKWTSDLRPCRNNDLVGCDGKHLHAECPLGKRSDALSKGVKKKRMRSWLLYVRPTSLAEHSILATTCPS